MGFRRAAAPTLTCVIGLLLAASFTAAPAQADVNYFTVDSVGDQPDANLGDGVCLTAVFFNCTLRAAIQQANATANAPEGPDQIGFIALNGPIQLASPLPALATDMAIVGGFAGGTTIQRANSAPNFRIFTITSSVHLERLTLANGFASGGDAWGGAVLMTGNSEVTIAYSSIVGNQAGALGGAVYNPQGRLTVVDSRFALNVADANNTAFHAGGAIATGSLSTTTVRGSTLQDNRSDWGGGLYNTGTLTVLGSTLSENVATGSGGGIFSSAGADVSLTVANTTIQGNAADTRDGGGLANLSRATVTSSTIAGNSASSGEGGGVYTTHSARLESTLVALNTAPVGPDLRRTGDNGAFTTAGHNLVGNADGSAGITNGANGDQAGSTASPLDPKLPINTDGKPDLERNGGPTETIRPLPGSPAIGRGSDAVTTSLPTDQRGVGFPRKVGAHVDVGAFERQAPVNIVPGAQATPEDSARVFSSSTGNPITVSELINPGDPLTTTLSVPAGDGTLAPGSTPPGVPVTGSGTASVTLTGTPSSIRTALDGLAFTPTADFNGPTTLTMTTDDNSDPGPGGALTDTDVVQISVTPVNDLPVARDDSAAAPAGTPVAVAVLANDSDTDGDILSVTTASDPPHGTAAIGADGTTITYTPDAGHSGSDTFAYTAGDGNGGTAPANVVVGVAGAGAPSDPPPTAADPAPGDPADTSAPAAPRITSPRSGAYDRDGSFALRGTAEPGVVVRLAERGDERGAAAADAGGAWSINLTRVRNGAHSYTATAADAAGNTSAASAPTTVIVDGVNPAVLRTRHRVSASGNIVALLSEAMDARSLTRRTVTLRRRGSPAKVGAAVRYVAARRRIVVDPRRPLAPGATYVATIRGGRAGATDLAGNPLKRTRSWKVTVRP